MEQFVMIEGAKTMTINSCKGCDYRGRFDGRTRSLQDDVASDREEFSKGSGRSRAS